MSKLKKDEGINIHQNFTLFQLFVIISNTLSAIMNEIQKKTPYGEEYTNCYQYYKTIVLNNLKVFEYYARKCQDRQEKLESPSYND